MKVVANYSDHWMRYSDGEGKTLTLNTNGGPSKREQFRLLKEAGFSIPPVGNFEDVIGSQWEEDNYTTGNCFVERCVIYDDEQAHCGEGKRMSMRVMQEFERSRGKFACAFVGDCNKPGISWRRLQIGPHCFWIEYRSDTDWRSNVGEGDTFVIGIEMNSRDNPFGGSYPLWAVDFVIGKEAWAIDLNTAPGVGNVLSRYISNEEIHKTLEEFIKAN